MTIVTETVTVIVIVTVIVDATAMMIAVVEEIVDAMTVAEETIVGVAMMIAEADIKMSFLIDS